MGSIADSWGTRAAERAHHYPCDDLAGAGWSALYRSVSIDAEPSVVFRWLCQLKQAPYSYDLLDNLGRRSPRRLTPGADLLEVGQSVMTIFRIASFEADRHLTLEYAPLLKRALPPLYVSYVVAPESGGTRLTCKLITPAARGALRRLSFRAVAWADLLMMRKQLLTLRTLAQTQAKTAAA